MKQYWVKMSAEAPADGPIDARELRRRVDNGRVGREHFISVDEIRWFRAERMKNLAFPAVETPANDNGEVVAEAIVEQAVVPPETEPAGPARGLTEFEVKEIESTPSPIEDVELPVEGLLPPIEEPVATTAAALQLATEAPSLDSSAPRYPRVRAPSQPAATNRPAAPFHSPAMQALQPDHVRIQPRKLTAFWLLAIVMFVALPVAGYLSALDVQQNISPQQILLMRAAALVFFVCSIPALILWILWLSRVHEEARRLSHGYYPVSAGKAIGLSFIPLFNWYWSVSMPLRLCREVNHHLMARALPTISCGLVATCQIVAIVMSVILPGIIPVLYAASMSQIQRGLNRLAMH